MILEAVYIYKQMKNIMLLIIALDYQNLEQDILILAEYMKIL